MMRLRKNLFVVAMCIYAMASNGPRPAMAADTDIWALQGGGTYYNVDVFRIDQSANVTFSTYNVTGVAFPHTTISNQGVVTFRGNPTLVAGADINFGSASSAASTTTTSGTSQGAIFTGLLAAGPGSGAGASLAASEGSVLCATTTASGGSVTLGVCGSATAILNMTTVAGIAAAAASTGSVVNVYDSGWVLALTTGTVLPGDQLITSNDSAGYLETATTVASTNTIAISLGNGNSAGGLTRVRIVK